MEKRSPAFGNERSSHFAYFLLTAVFLLASWHCSAGTPENASPGLVRKAAVAGGFYPGSKAELERFIDQLLDQADPPEIKEPIRAIMVPHAGYVYSGPVAAFAYKTIAGRDIRTVILMCNSHRHYFDGIAVYGSGAFETPLGNVPVASEVAQKLLAANPRIVNRPEVHNADHVLEVQLPFLQRTLTDFKIVPVLFGNDDPSLSQVLAKALEPVLDDHTLLVASTDMSHYPPYNAAAAADQATLQAILTGHAATLNTTLANLKAQRVPNAETFLCGASGVRTVLHLAPKLGAAQPQLLKYANSGDSVIGEKNRVVGYGAVVFADTSGKSKGMPPASAGTAERPADDKVVNAEDEKELLKLARDTVESFIRSRKVPDYTPSSPGLRQKLGAFVTLRERGELRGCIGRFEPDAPLFTVIQQMAVSAATQDPRFRPVSPDELDQLTYEISVLSPLRKVPNAEPIEVGKHGVQVSKGFHGGVFLPQVATETGWTKEEFLSELCTQKAGLPPDCWKDPAVDLYIFTAQILEGKKE
ncbi:MAG: AmmeMemoRadiSam system protein B [Candidatus Omnitrophica bacterium]|nr:AmmeMemoRadiSam system protein B [Candidatus Omnitrophota bacterium]